MSQGRAPELEAKLAGRVAVWIGWQWSNPAQTLADVEAELIAFLAPYAPSAVQRYVTTAADVDDRKGDAFHQLVDDNAAAPFDAIVFLSQFDLFLLCEESIEFFSWVKVLQNGGARVYFVRDDLDGGATLQAFLSGVVF